MSDHDGAEPPSPPSPPSSRSLQALALAFVLILSTTLIYIFMDTPVIAPAARLLHNILHRPSTMTAPDGDLSKMCNGRGILIQSTDSKNRHCICDINWSGQECEHRNVHSSTGKGALLVVERFTSAPATAPLFPASMAPLATLAGFMARSGIQLTVLVCEGDESANEKRQFERQFPSAQLVYLSRVSHLVSAKKHTVNDKQHYMTVSSEILRYLSTREQPFEYVLFTGHSGLGYATLTAVRQGYHCISSLFGVLIDSPTKAQIAQIVNHDHLVTDPQLLRLDYMQQKAVELADVVIAPNRMVLDVLTDNQWRLPESVYHLPLLTLPVQHNTKEDHREEVERADELIPNRQSPIREFVYIGPLGQEGGLEVFLGAIDALLARDARSHRKLLGKAKHVKVTFFGHNAVADAEEGWTGEHLLEQRSISWGNRVKWSVSKESQLRRIFQYLMEPGKARLAILPSPHDQLCPTTFFLHQALRAGVPIIASNLRSAQELVHLQDRRDCLFQVNDAGALAKRMAEAWANGVLLARPQFTLRHLETQWRQLLADLNARPPASCPLPKHSTGNETMISIILVHHNRPALLQQAIRSIEQQTILDQLQVVLVDDGSTDPAADRLLSELAWRWWQERGWKVIREPNRYLGAARNTGVRHARGKYVMFMDDDDLMKADKCEAMLRVAEQSGADIVTCGHDTFSGHHLQFPLTNSVRYLPVGASKSLGVLENCFGDSSFLVHRTFFLDSGGFTEEYGVGFEDYEYLAKMALRDNHLETIPDALNLYRQHHQDSMSTETDLKANQMRFMRAYLDMFGALSKSLQRLVRHAQYVYFERDGPKPFFYQNCGCNSTCTDDSTSSTTASSTSTSTVSSTSSSSSVSVSSSTGIITSSTFFTTDFTFNTTTTTESLSSSSTTSESPSSTTESTSTSTLSTSTRAACPCRSVRRKRQQPSSAPSRSQRPTCYTTATVTPTITRMARPCTVLTTVELPPMCSGPDCFFFNGTTLIAPSNPAYTISTTRLLDQAPPRPPLAKNAEFLPHGSQIMIHFDQPVNVQVGRSFECDHFFDPRPINIPNGAFLGGDCKAMFVSSVELRLSIGGKFLGRERRAVRPQSLLVFRPNVLGNVGTMNRAFVQGTIEVLAPEQPVKPIVIMEGPSGVVVGEQEIRIDLSKSLNSAGRPFTDAHFDVTSSAGMSGFVDVPLQQLLHSAAIDAVKNHRLLFTIPSALLQDYVTYTIHCSLWNFFGEYGSSSLTFSKVPSGSADSGRRPLVISGPSSVSQSQPVRLSAVQYADKQLKLYWFVIKSPQPLKIKHASRPVIEFDQLPLGRYVIGLRTLQHGTTEYLFTHQFQVHIGQPVAQIVGGSRQIGAGDSILLSPRIVDLTSRATLPNDHFNYTWRCYQSDRQSPCQHRLTGALLDWQPNQQGAIQFDAAMLTAGEYEMELMVSNKDGNLVMPASVTMVVSSEDHLPALSLDCEDPLPAVNLDTIQLVANASNDTNLKTFTWESLPICAGQYYATLPHLASRHLKTTNHTDTLQLPASALLPGASYCFRVTMADLVTGKRSFSFHTITTRHQPEGGWCELTVPAVGEALKSKLCVACHGWTTDPSSPQLLYQLQAKKRSGSIITLSALQDRPTFTTALDVGHYLLQVVVQDEAGGVQKIVPVRPVSMRMPDNVADYRSQFILDSDNQDEETTILGVVGGFPSTFRQDLNNTVLNSVFAALDRASATGTSSHHAAFLLDTLQRISPPRLGVDQRPTALKVLSRVAGHMQCSRDMVQGVITALQPVLANPRGGLGASFLYQDIVNKVEECASKLTQCGEPAFVFDTKLQSWTIGWFDTSSQSQVVGSFTLPPQLSQFGKCIPYRHISTTNGNLMRNSSIDTNMLELRLTSPDTLQPLSPWFTQPLPSMNITFSIPLSKEARRKIAYRRVIPHCVWFDRGANASSSWWSSEGCQVVRVDREQVQCACSHLTEFAVFLEPKFTQMMRLRGRLWVYLAGGVVSLMVLLAVLVLVAWFKRPQQPQPTLKAPVDDDTDTIRMSASEESLASTLNGTE